MDFTFDVFRGSESGKIIQDRITRTLGSNDALLDITHGSLCGTDKFYLHSTQVLGHESVGVVKQVGSDVTSVNIGDRVGLGYIQSVCGTCKNCITGWDQYCRDRQRYGFVDPNQGSLGSQAIWDAGSLVPIPDVYSSAHAAAILCGGATVWTLLTRNNIQVGQRVGVLGVGGMGHLAIKLSAALGYHTVVFSHSDSKRDDCLAFGAREFYVFPSRDEANELHDVTPAGGAIQPVDHLLLCSSVSNEYGSLLPLMATHGTIYPLTVSLEATSIPLSVMIDNGLRIQGSLTASNEGLRELFEFCSGKSILPMIQKFSFNQLGLEKAVTALQTGSLRYKAVLECNYNVEAKPLVERLLFKISNYLLGLMGNIVQ